MNEYKSFVNGIGLIGISNIFITLSSFILIPIITKNLSASDYGIWVQVNVTMALLPYIITLGLPSAMIRFISTEKNKKNIQEGFYSIFCIILVFSLIATIILFLFSKIIANALFNGNTSITILMILIIFFVSLNLAFFTFLKTFQQMKIFSLLSVIQAYIPVFLVAYFITFLGTGIFSIVLVLLITQTILFLILSYLIIAQIGLKIPNFTNIRKYLSFGIPLTPSILSYWIVDSSDRYLISILLGTTFVGYYSPGYALGTVILMFTAPLNILLPSVLPKFYEENNFEKMNKFLEYSLKYFLLIAIPSVFGLSFLSKSMLLILSTTEIALNGYLVTPFIALSSLLIGIYGIQSNLLILKNKTNIVGTIWIIAAILNFILTLILIPLFGIIAAAAASLFAYIVVFVFTNHYSLKDFEFDFDINFIIKCTLSSILMIPIIWVMNPDGILSILVTIIICSIIYLSALIMLKGMKKEEFTFFKDIILNRQEEINR